MLFGCQWIFSSKRGTFKGPHGSGLSLLKTLHLGMTLFFLHAAASLPMAKHLSIFPLTFIVFMQHDSAQCRVISSIYRAWQVDIEREWKAWLAIQNYAILSYGVLHMLSARSIEKSCPKLKQR